VTKNLLSLVPPCFGRHVKPLVPAAIAVFSTHQPALCLRGGLCPVLLMCNPEKGPCLSSGDLNRLIKWVFATLLNRLGRLHYELRTDDGAVWRRHLDQLISTRIPPSAPTTHARREGGTVISIHTYHSRLIPEGVAEASQKLL
jgi:hypothetical protein